MRLKSSEVQKIHEVLKQQLSSFKYQIYLFGSRADDNKKGGDIDLLLLCAPQDYNTIWDKKFIIKSYLEFALDDQRVDLTLATAEKMQSDIFLKSISSSLIEL